MITSCKFNPMTDFQEVVPGLAMSIHMALTTGAIKDTTDTTPYTKETDVENVGHYLTDPIDIALENRRVQGILSQPTSNEANFNTSNPE